MSRPSHRKSQSTSALAFLASHDPSSSASASASPPIPPSLHLPKDRNRSTHSTYRHNRLTMLPSVEESIGNGSASMSVLPGLSGPSASAASMASSSRRHSRHMSQVSIASEMSRHVDLREPDKGELKERSRSRKSDKPEEDIEGWLSDLRSLRTSDRRRLVALRGLERCLVTTCIQQQAGHTASRAIEILTSQAAYQTLIGLLTRHTQTLSHRAASTTITPGDEIAAILIPELDATVSMLQGLCLLSKGCKTLIGENWVLEMFIDLLLLLRAQPAIEEGTRPIAYNIMELLFCVLVDSPKTSRSFEKLSGLEAVTRVLKGTGVAKDVRMKCIEFLYFYLLPEQNETSRTVSSSSTSSTSSTDSHLYPPSPLSTSQNSDRSVKFINPERRSPSPHSGPRLADVDLPFVPMTPRKRPQPALGYLTPSTRKVSVCGGASASSTPSLATVPASPRMEHSASSRGLAAMMDEMGTGATPRSSKMGRTRSDDSQRSGDGVGVGLGLGLPKSTSGIVQSSTIQRDLSSDKTGSPNSTSTSTTPFTDPFNLTLSSERSHSGSSGSSTVVPSPRSISRSSTQPSLAIPPSQNGSHVPSSFRRSSVRRVSKSPLVQSIVPEQGETLERRSSVASTVNYAYTPAEPTQPVPRTPKVRHSRTQSHLSALTSTAEPVPPVPVVPSHLTPSATSTDLRAQTRSPSKPRAFPAELTRGLPPSASSPSLSQTLSQIGNSRPSPLGATKRVPSDKRQSISVVNEYGKGSKSMALGGKGKGKDVRSVEEKKEMLGMWLGNVEQLVQGVEKVSIWGSVGAAKPKGKR